MVRYDDKVVVITGGTRGIGFATAQAFLQRGACVALCGRQTDTADAARRQLRGRDRLVTHAVDVRDWQAVERFVQSVRTELGPIGVLVNSAGIAHVGPFAAQAWSSMAELIDVNVKGAMFASRAVLPHMIEAADGVIVNIASGAGLSGFANLVSYCTSKFAVVGFTEALDLEVRERGVRVYGLCPGKVATDMQVLYSGAKVGMPPERIADKVVELAAPGSRARTGRCHTVG